MNLRNVLTAAAALVLVQSAVSAAFAASDRDMLEAYAKCADEADASARLACFDAVTPRLRETLAAPAVAVPPPAAVAAAPPTEQERESFFGLDVGNWFRGDAKQDEPDEFGAEKIAKTPEQESEELQSIETVVREYAFNPAGKFIVVLENGQVWMQIPGDTGKALFRRNPADNRVKISRAFLGSYNLQINGSNWGYKVSRVK